MYYHGIFSVQSSHSHSIQMNHHERENMKSIKFHQWTYSWFQFNTMKLNERWANVGTMYRSLEFMNCLSNPTSSATTGTCYIFIHVSWVTLLIQHWMISWLLLFCVGLGGSATYIFVVMMSLIQNQNKFSIFNFFFPIKVSLNHDV